MAKKFVYRLEPILKLKEYEAKLAKDNLARIMKLRQEKEQEIQDLNEYLEKIKISKVGRQSVQELQANFYHKEYVKNERSKKDNEKKQLLEIENVNRVKVIEATKQEKIYQKYKEKKFEQYKIELESQDFKDLDEISINKRLIENNDDLKL